MCENGVCMFFHHYLVEHTPWSSWPGDMQKKSHKMILHIKSSNLRKPLLLCGTRLNEWDTQWDSKSIVWVCKSSLQTITPSELPSAHKSFLVFILIHASVFVPRSEAEYVWQRNERTGAIEWMNIKSNSKWSLPSVEKLIWISNSLNSKCSFSQTGLPTKAKEHSLLYCIPRGFGSGRRTDVFMPKGISTKGKAKTLFPGLNLGCWFHLLRWWTLHDTKC